jgi:hypothetical protein
MSIHEKVLPSGGDLRENTTAICGKTRPARTAQPFCYAASYLRKSSVTGNSIVGSSIGTSM